MTTRQAPVKSEEAAPIVNCPKCGRTAKLYHERNISKGKDEGFLYAVYHHTSAYDRCKVQVGRITREGKQAVKAYMRRRRTERLKPLYQMEQEPRQKRFRVTSFDGYPAELLYIADKGKIPLNMEPIVDAESRLKLDVYADI